MRISVLIGLFVALVVSVALSGPPAAEEDPVPGRPAGSITTIKPAYLPPSDILGFLGVRMIGGRGIMEWETADHFHSVEIRCNDAANLLVLSGEPADVETVERMIQEADVAPHQIEIQVKIVEVRSSRAKDSGIDWQRALDALQSANTRIYYDYDKLDLDQQEGLIKNGTVTGEVYERDESRHDLSVQSNFNLTEVLRILDESGVGTIHNAPRILTLNNHPATILDGKRVTYVNRYSSYTNLYETESMDAGLTLSVLPSLGESGYITLHIDAELTALSGSISGSPVKQGQMLENTVLVRDGQSVPLGGLTRTVETTVHKRLPILGHAIPYLFSRKTTLQEEVETYLIITPRVVDLTAAE